MILQIATSVGWTLIKEDESCDISVPLRSMHIRTLEDESPVAKDKLLSGAGRQSYLRLYEETRPEGPKLLKEFLRTEFVIIVNVQDVVRSIQFNKRYRRQDRFIGIRLRPRTHVITTSTVSSLCTLYPCVEFQEK